MIQQSASTMTEQPPELTTLDVGVSVVYVEKNGGGGSVRNLRAKGLALDGVSFRIPTTADANTYVDETHGEDSWRAKILRVLHNRYVQIGLLLLLLLDVIILFTELFLAASYPACHFIESDGISCCEATGDAVAGDRFRWLAEEEHHGFCPFPYIDTDNPTACDDHKYDAVHHAEHAFFIMTLIILSLFMVELILLISALTPCVFFKQVFYVLDLFIVTVSIGLEVTFHKIGDDQAAAYSGLLVMARCWRFVRIGHGLIEATAELTSMRYEKIVEMAEELELQVAAHEKKLKEGDDTWSETESLREFAEKSKILLDAIVEKDPNKV